MLFLVRTAFWLTIVLAFLPGLPKSTDSKGPDINPLEALTAASAAVSDAGGFCSRQPQACAIGSQVLDAVGERAEAGARMVYGYVSAQVVDQKRKAAERAVGRPAQDTLTADDLSPIWQGLPKDQPAPHDMQEAHVPLPPKRPA